jgi:hypothetical protein
LSFTAGRRPLGRQHEDLGVQRALAERERRLALALATRLALLDVDGRHHGEADHQAEHHHEHRGDEGGTFLAVEHADHG